MKWKSSSHVQTQEKLFAILFLSAQCIMLYKYIIYYILFFIGPFYFLRVYIKNENFRKQTKFVVFLPQLMEMFANCPPCNKPGELINVQKNLEQKYKSRHNRAALNLI